jgi:hypothetical protein
MNELLAGSLAGLGATVPMSVAREVGRSRLPEPEHYPLYPTLVTDSLAEKAGVADELGDEGVSLAAVLAHFGYGAASGAAYGPLRPHIPLPLGLRGAAFGLSLFAAGYLGWLPALGVLPPATRYPTGRRRLLMGVHLLWGMTADLLLSCCAAADS